MSQLRAYIPLVAGSLIVSGVVIASGGSILQSGIAGVATGATGLATSTLVVQSQSNKQRLIEQERDELRLEIENLKSLSNFSNELEKLQNLAESLQRSINRLDRHNSGLSESKDINPKPEESNDTGDREEPVESSPKVIVDFLESRNMTIKTIPTDDMKDDVINSLSKFLGENYDGLRELLGKIKRSMQQGSSFSLSLREYTQKDVSNVCQFCTRLHAIAFLEDYRYFKSPQYLIRARATTLPIAQNFFSGKWLERFVLLTVQKCVNLVSDSLEKNIAFSYLLNPQIILPNGDDFELDLICYVNGFFFWIEAKSGDYQHHISKYSRMSKILALDSRHSIMVLPDISEDQCVALTSLFSMTVCSLSQLEKILTETIKNDQL